PRPAWWPPPCWRAAPAAGASRARYCPGGPWLDGLGDAPGVCPHISRAVVPMGSWVCPGTAPVRGACEVLADGLGLGEVGVGLGLGEVGDGDGLTDVGDGDGVFCAGGLAPTHGADDAAVLLCPAEALDEGALELP